MLYEWILPTIFYVAYKKRMMLITICVFVPFRLFHAAIPSSAVGYFCVYVEIVIAPLYSFIFTRIEIECIHFGAHRFFILRLSHYDIALNSTSVIGNETPPNISHELC